MNANHRISVFSDRHILLGVTGSIAAYKAVDLASKLTHAGAQVEVILTEAAENFVTPLTFRSITGRAAFTEDDFWGSEAHLLHVSLAEWAQLLVIAPATANTIAKMAQGLADSLLTVTALAARCPLLLAPAMDAGMFGHPATQANLATLRDRGAVVVGPVEGRMASGLVGMGRMVEPEHLLGAIRLQLGKDGPLAGRKIVVTAGGTQEPIDPVRVLTNLSSGKQGLALAQAALDLGAEVTLIAAPVSLPFPVGVELVKVSTSSEMKEAVLAAVAEADALLMAAAVADFRPAEPSEEKIKRHEGAPKIHFEPAEDILALVSAEREKTGRPSVTVGFAAESQDLVANARKKLIAKGLSMIVANDITAPDSGFASDTNRVVILDEEGDEEQLPLMTKAKVAEAICARLPALLSSKS